MSVSATPWTLQHIRFPCPLLSSRICSNLCPLNWWCRNSLSFILRIGEGNGKSHGRRNLVGCSPWGCEESDTTERLHFHFSFSCTGEGNGSPLQCFAWRIPGTAEPGRLPPMGSHRVGHDWSDLAAVAAYSEWVHFIMCKLYFNKCVKDWRWEEKGMTEDEMVGWHHQLNGHEFWVNSGSWWWTVRPGMLQSMGLQRVRHDWATELTDWKTWKMEINTCTHDEIHFLRLWQNWLSKQYSHAHAQVSKSVSVSSVLRVPPLDCKEIKPVNHKRNQPWIFTGRTDAEAETPILWSPDAKNWLSGKDPEAGKDWRQEEKGTEDEMVGRYHQLDGCEFEQALGVDGGQGSLAYYSPWSHKELDTTEQLKLNWSSVWD